MRRFDVGAAVDELAHLAAAAAVPGAVDLGAAEVVLAARDRADGRARRARERGGRRGRSSGLPSLVDRVAGAVDEPPEVVDRAGRPSRAAGSRASRSAAARSGAGRSRSCRCGRRSGRPRPRRARPASATVFAPASAITRRADAREEAAARACRRRRVGDPRAAGSRTRTAPRRRSAAASTRSSWRAAS